MDNKDCKTDKKPIDNKEICIKPIDNKEICIKTINSRIEKEFCLKTFNQLTDEKLMTTY